MGSLCGVGVGRASGGGCFPNTSKGFISDCAITQKLEINCGGIWPLSVMSERVEPLMATWGLNPSSSPSPCPSPGSLESTRGVCVPQILMGQKCDRAPLSGGVSPNPFLSVSGEHRCPMAIKKIKRGAGRWCGD